MPLQLVRKPPVGNVKSDRLKVTLAGRHTLKQKASMLMQVKFWLQHEQGIDIAGPSDVYFSLLDPNGYPLTSFRDGQAISDYMGSSHDLHKPSWTQRLDPQQCITM